MRCARWLVLGITDSHSVTMVTMLEKMRYMQAHPSTAPFTLRVGEELVRDHMQWSSWWF